MDNIVKLFKPHNILTDDDLEVIDFAPSKYLQRKVLLKCLLCLKLPVWLMICDLLLENKSTKQVGNKLMDGKLCKNNSVDASI